MSNFNFACRFIKAEDGTEIIKCRDLPELLSWPADGESKETWARYAVEDCIAFRIKDGIEVPPASPAQDNEFIVELTPTEEAKILLHNTMVDSQIGRSTLASKAHLSLPEVTRLLNLKHRTKIDSVALALNSLGKKLNLSLQSL